MISLIQNALPYKVLFAHFLFAFLILALVFRESWGKVIVGFIHRHSLLLGLLVSLSAIVGSMFYSNILGFPPCELCWWQRVLIYPQAALFLVALRNKDRSVFNYSWVLSSLAALVSLYQIWVQSGGVSILDCTAVGGECLKVYVNAFGYITIPVMSLTVSAYLLLLAYINRKHE
ncbi:disulfide bond formation protein B [Candidatus Parcubacteria bacterium]|nr:disulfide bond formation protein B [Candidatus Parcubacteria bacterium]